MPFSPARARTRVGTVISVCAVALISVSFFASRQQAGEAPAITTVATTSDKGGISPEATITVNSLADVANGTDGVCSLREAITAANNNAASGALAGECAAGSNSGSDAISFSVVGTINLTSALPDIASDMAINGPGSAQLTVRRNSADFYRIFTIASGTVGLSGLTVKDGRTPDLVNLTPNGGGGIKNSGTLTMSDVIVTSNQTGTSPASGSGAEGGGIANLGTLVMSNCAVTGNSTSNSSNPSSNPSRGGGISSVGPLTMTNCTVSGNVTGGTSGGSGGIGGGIFSNGPLTLTSTTISNNVTGNGVSLGANGGGIYSVSTATLLNCTVSSNSTGDPNTSSGIVGAGGGIWSGASMVIAGSAISDNTSSDGAIMIGSSLIITNSTVSGNHSLAAISSPGSSSSMAMTNCTVAANVGNGLYRVFNSSVRNSIIAGNGTDVSGAFNSLGHNLIGNGDSAGGSFVNGVNGDQVGNSASPLNAHLGSLANNGGATKTHALLSNSTALDAGDDCVTQLAHCGDSNLSQLLNDQRGAGFSRQVDGPDVDTTATVDIGAYEMQTPLANLADTSTNEDTQAVVPFEGGDPSTITSVTASSSNTTLVPNDVAHLNAAMTGSSGTVTINPAADLSGTTDITVTINRTGGPESKTFMLTVNPVNDVPVFTKGADQTLSEDAGAQTVNNWASGISAGPADESAQTLTFQIVNNSNPSLFSAGPVVGSDGTLTYTPAANASGSSTITINIKDNGGTANGGVDTSASQTFAITVNSVNDPPSFTKGADLTVNEDAGAQTVANWATAISRGPAEEAAQTLTFQVINNTNTALFSAGPAISSTGTLTYTPTANASGSATITINLKDNGGTANGGVDTSANQTFTITVNPVNDAPSFTKGANQTVNEDAGAQTVSNWATAISAGAPDESGQTLTFEVTGNTNAALFSAGPAISSTGVLTYTPAADANGSATLTINLKDSGGTANGGVDTSASQTFTITVNSVNDAPSFTRGADQTVSNNAGAQSVANWATNLSAGPANESGQTLSFQITGNTFPGLFTTAPAVSSTGTLTYTPGTNAAGTSTITIRIQDSGGTANGGIATSPSQTFTITIVPAGGLVALSAFNYNTTESSGFTTVTVNRTGDLTKAVTVDYRTNDSNNFPCSTVSGSATPKCDFTTAIGTLNFAAGENSKTVTILISQDVFVEGPETFSISLLNPTNNAAASSASSSITIADDVTEPATNPIDDVRNFVRQHYHDFLGREPDANGWDFWTNQITSCGNDVQCNEVRRIDVSASFFLSIEFQQSGYLVERFYKVAYGDVMVTSRFGSTHQIAVPILQYNEFVRDTRRIGEGVVVLQPGWEQLLESNKQAYALEFVQTTRFISGFPASMTPTAFVDRLNQNSGGVMSLSERQTAINLFGGAGNSSNVTARAQAVRMVAEDTDLYNAEYNRAFVLVQYFGYLRRNPIEAPDTDYTGYDFWLTKLNQFNGNYINAEMVKAFLSSIEYRQRFGP